MTAGLIGQMVTPDSGNRIVSGVTWALDNGCFNARWTPDKWLAALDQYVGVAGCLFAVVPDVVGDARATDQLWARWHGAVRNRGYRAAYVLQNGCKSIPASAGAVFIGGDDTFKLGPEARRLAVQAKTRGLWVHMGRVNSRRRLEYAAGFCDSVDGTFLAFGPDVNLPRLTRMLRHADHPRLIEEPL